MNSKFATALSIAVAKDALDALINAGYLATLGAIAPAGIPILLMLDIVVALSLAAISRNMLFLPVAVVEALPGLQMFPTWTLVVVAMRSKFGDGGGDLL